VFIVSNRLNDDWVEFENEFESFKERMDKKFTFLEENLSSIKSHTGDLLIFKKFITRLIDFIINAVYFIFGVLITVLIFK
jgi:hypothetical protein